MSAKLKLKTNKKVKKVVNPGVDFVLPEQNEEEIQLLDTDPKVLFGLPDPSQLRAALEKSKESFLKDIHQIAGEHGLSANLRIYFTFKTKE